MRSTFRMLTFWAICGWFLILFAVAFYAADKK